MSHEIIHETYKKTVNKEKVWSELNDIAEKDDWQEGGGLNKGIRWLEDKVYDNYEDAEKAIEQLDDGWYDNLAVLYKDYSHVKPSKKMLSIREKIKETSNKRNNLDNKSTEELHTRKSAYLGCKECGSKLATKYLKFNKCPMCGAELRSETIMNRLDAMTNKLKELNKEYTKEQKKLNKKAETKWLVKVEYHV